MRQIIVLSVALAVSLVGTYLTWTDDSEEVSDDVVYVYDASETELQKLSWNSAELTVVAERRKDDRGEYLWVESRETKVPKAKPPGHPGEEAHPQPEGEEHEGEETPAAEGAPAEGSPAEPEAPPEVKVSRFVASAQGEEMWKSFAPLKALRELDTAGADPKTFGFEEGAEVTTIEAVVGGKVHSLRLGGETYGNKDRYVRAGEKTYLLDDATLRPLQFAGSRLVERSLFPLAEADIEKVDVRTPAGATVSYVQQNRDDRTKAFWARAEATDKEDESGATWLDKAFKLKLKEYVDETTVTGTLEPVGAYTIYGKGEQWPVELLKVTEGDKSTFYARSPYNRSLVLLTESVARNVVDDLAELGGA